MVIHILGSYLKCLELTMGPWGGRRLSGRKRERQAGQEVRKVGTVTPSFGFISSTTEEMNLPWPKVRK